MNLSNGKIWPYAIGASIITIFGACVATVFIANTLPVEKSDTYMMGYHEANDKANELLQAKILFEKHYKIEYITEEFGTTKAILSYKISDKDANPIDNANIKVVVTRPNNHKHDQELSNPKVQNGIYTFEPITLPQEGRWDIMAKVSIGELERFYNIKTDTRGMQAVEY